jgi:hypothetical protein
VISEYSYFRAEGFSLEAIQIVKEAQEEMRAITRRICAPSGAGGIVGGYDAALGRYDITAFQFWGNNRPPEDWETIAEGKGGATLAMPRPGSKDHFNMVCLCGLMEQAYRHATLEGVFGCGDMPRRAHPAGDFETVFVRTRLMREDGSDKGKVYGEAAGLRGAAAAGESRDPLSHAELNKAFYIRVPNRPGTEDPAFVPPDAVPVPLDRMLHADQAEMTARIRDAMNNCCFGC